jgi:hypothetical protein
MQRRLGHWLDPARSRHAAEQVGIVTLRMVISRHNWPMQQFAHKAGASLDFVAARDSRRGGWPSRQAPTWPEKYQPPDDL